MSVEQNIYWEVRQVRSGNRRPKDQRETLACLGLGKIGRARRFAQTNETRGMLRKVAHLITVRAVEGE